MKRLKLQSIINWELHQKLQKPSKISKEYHFRKKRKRPPMWPIWLSILLGLALALSQLYK